MAAVVEGNCHVHGRWTGLFKLAEETGELIVAAIDLIEAAGEGEQTEALRAFENELADVGAACGHVVEANRLDKDRMATRRDATAERLGRRIYTHGRTIGLGNLIRRCGALQQLLGKIAAFPHGTDHPDSAGDLVLRLEAAIVAVVDASSMVTTLNGLDAEHMQLRGDDKLDKFRTWFPGPAPELEEAAE